MEQDIKDQILNGWPGMFRYYAPQSMDQIPDEADPPPPLISKKWLCHRFELIKPNGLPNYKMLYAKVLTPVVIQAMGATVEEIRRCEVKIFTRQQTVILIQVLGL